MSTRNPMNERNTRDVKSTGKTRRSAASAKPVMKAASSVYVRDTDYKPKKSLMDRITGKSAAEEESKQSKKQKKISEEAQKRAEEKVEAANEERKKAKKKGKYTLVDLEGDEYETRAVTKEDKKVARKKFLNPGTQDYRFWRTIWAILICTGIVFLILPIVNADMFVGNDTLSMANYGLCWALILGAIAIDALKIRPIRKRARKNAKLDTSKEATRARKKAKRQAAQGNNTHKKK